MNRKLTLAALALVCTTAATIPAIADVLASGAVATALPASTDAVTAANVAAANPAIVANPAVVIPYGQYVAGVGQLLTSILVPILTGVITLAVGRVAPWATLFLSQQRTESAVQNVLNYALNAVEGATKDKTLSIPVGSAVVATAVQRGLDAVPSKVLDAMGGPAGLAERVFRSLHLDENADAQSVLQPALAQIRAQTAK